jgi:radical SAM protein with 4Fe4S-binding SPASM domain
MKQGNTFKDKLYCTSPFNSLFIRPNGDVASCCAGFEKWGNLKENTIDEIIHSDTAVRIRNNVLSGIEDSYCKWCIQTENSGCSSQRRGFAHLDVDLNKEFELKTLDIRWSTICNFSCIYCNEDWSSTWAKKKNLPIVSDNLTISNDILNYIEKNSSTIDSILVAGGEPLLQMQNEKLFDILPPSTKIMLISNLGVDLKKSKIFNKLSQRKHIDWAVSLENVGNHFEYARQGGYWDLMVSNLKHIQETTTHYINFQCIFHILSLLKLKDLFNVAEEMGINIEWQIIGDNTLALDPLLYEGDIREKSISILEDVLNTNWSIQYNRDFLLDNLNNLKNNIDINPLNDVNKNMIEFINNQETLYNTSNHSFRELWPEFDNLFLKK